MTDALRLSNELNRSRSFKVLFETAMLRARKQLVARFLGDFSAIVTAVLFALCIPPLAPWWIACLGMFFAIVIA